MKKKYNIYSIKHMYQNGQFTGIDFLSLKCEGCKEFDIDIEIEQIMDVYGLKAYPSKLKQTYYQFYAFEDSKDENSFSS